MAPFVGMVLTLCIEAVSITSTPPGAWAIPTYTRLPSLPTAMLLGWPLSGTRLITFSDFPSTMSSELSASSLGLTRAALEVGVRRSFESALVEVEDLYLHELMKTEDANEGVRAFMEKRKPEWRNK